MTQVQNILLSAGASTIHHVSSIGQGMAMKLAVNALFGIQVVALAKIIGMLIKNGVDLPKAIECLGDLPVISPAARSAANLMLTDNHAAMFPIELVEKNFRYMTQTAQAVAAEVPVSMGIHHIYQQAITLGYGSDNITAVARLFI